MSLWKIAWRSIQQRMLSSALTSFSMALGVALVCTVLVVHRAVDNTFGHAAHGYDLIVGAKGSRLQLVLNTVFHLDRPIENIPYSYYKEFTQGKFKPEVMFAIPCCLGDSYEGFRVIGTTSAMFEKLQFGDNQKYAYSSGRNFDDAHFFESVIGASVARETGLKVGDTFQPTHGVQEEGHAHDPFTVVGILIPTGTPSDRGLFINIEGFYLQEDHAKPGPAHEAKHAADDPDAHDHDAHEKDGDALESKERDAQEQDGDPEPGAPQPTDEDACVLQPGDDHAHDDHAHDDHDHGHDARDHHHHRHEPLPESQREVTAILVRTNGPMALGLDNVINEGNEAQAVSPIREVVVLLDTFVRPLEYVFLGLAILIVIVAGVGMMVAMYNSMSERRREIAIMRALGASRQAVTTIILLESILLALAGGLLGVLLGHGLLAVASPYVIEFSHVSVGFLQFEPIELGLIPGLVVLATLVGLVPALTAYRTDVSHALSASP